MASHCRSLVIYIHSQGRQTSGKRQREDRLGWGIPRLLGPYSLLLWTYVCFLWNMTGVNTSDAGAAPDQWKTWWIIFCLILGPILIGVFVFVESKVSSPLMPLSIWRVPQFAKLMLCFGVGFGAFMGSIIFGWSLYFQQIYGASPIVVSTPDHNCVFWLGRLLYTLFHNFCPGCRRILLRRLFYILCRGIYYWRLRCPVTLFPVSLEPCSR